jgi:ATP-binding cassette subfamily B protein
MFRLLDLEIPPDGEEVLPAGAVSAEVRDLSFTYPGAENPALDGVTFDLGVGLISVVGESGSGKSTIAAILSGARHGYTGSVRIGGAELRTLSKASLRDRVTLVPHDGYVFSGSVAENLRMANGEATDAELVGALKRARLWDFFAEGDGLDTRLAERGANLSGGQRQRLCLARALLRHSDCYIFDEATSNIDTESEGAIMEAIRALAETKTVLLITHRLANAAPSKMIYLLQGGRMIEAGTHGELLSREGAYARMYNRQTELERYAGGAAL